MDSTAVTLGALIALAGLGLGGAAALASWRRAGRLAIALAEAEIALEERSASLSATRLALSQMSQDDDTDPLKPTAHSPAASPPAAPLLDESPLLDAAPFPIWRRDAEGRLIWVNRRYADLTEASPAETVARGVELASAHDLDGPKRLAEMAREAGGPVAEDRRFVAEGDRRNYRAFELPFGEGFLGFAQDITGEADARGQLRRHMEAHHEVLRAISTATAIYGTDQRLLLWNRAYARLWQLDEAWLETRPSFGEVLEQLRAGRRLPEQIDWQAYKRAQLDLFTTVIDRREDLIHLPDGSALRLVATPYPSGGLLFAYDDVTRQLSLERTTNTLIAVQRATLDNLYEAVVVYGSDGRLSLYNRAYTRLWQLDPEFLNRQPHITEVLEATRPLLLQGGDWSSLRAAAIDGFTARRPAQGRMEREDGAVIDFAGVPLPDGAMLYTYLDVSDTIRIERALRDRNETLERSDRMNATFISNVTHELRAPLGTLLSMNEVLHERILGPLNERQQEYSADMLRTAKQLMLLLDEIITIAAIDGGQMELEPERFAAGALWQDEQSAWAAAADHKGIALALPEADGALMLTGDRERLAQALGRVVSAAIAGTPTGGNVRLTYGHSTDGRSAMLTVESHAAGLAPLRPMHVFDDLESGQNGGVRAHANLSLIVARGLIGLHRGAIHLRRTEDGGQAALIRLPLDGAGPA